MYKMFKMYRFILCYCKDRERWRYISTHLELHNRCFGDLTRKRADAIALRNSLSFFFFFSHLAPLNIYYAPFSLSIFNVETVLLVVTAFSMCCVSTHESKFTIDYLKFPPHTKLEFHTSCIITLSFESIILTLV